MEKENFDYRSLIGKSLKEVLDFLEIDSSNDWQIIVYPSDTKTEMRVSRRYLESEPWKYILNSKVTDYGIMNDKLYDCEMLAFDVEIEED